MILTVKRLWPGFACVIGQLYIDGVPEAYSLEDTVRPDGVKVDGETAIPQGRYRIIRHSSKRFGCDLPMLLDVPMFTDILIHNGCTAKDTRGCILVGQERHDHWIGKSRLALDALLPKVWAGLDAGEVWITVEGAAEGDPTFVRSNSGDRIG